jgi:hypothetical protein
VAPEFLGRAASLTSLVDDGLLPAAMAGFGALAGATSVAAACVLAGTAMAALCLWSATRLGARARPPARRARRR